jgi:predicted metalloprotease with PDZ domain
MRAVVQKIVEAEVALFGDIPYHDYTFFLHLRPTGGGGLEHLNSTGSGFGASDFPTQTVTGDLARSSRTSSFIFGT